MKPIQHLMAMVLIAFIAPAGAEWTSAGADIMGTRINVTLWHEEPATAERLIEKVLDEMRRIDHQYSPYRPDSELSQMNEQAGRRTADNPLPVSDKMTRLLDKSLFYGRLTDGAFDITFASVGRYYDYRAGKTPSDSQYQQLVEAIDYRHVVLDKKGQSVYYQHPAVYVDLGGIAKGYAVDQAIELLENAGVQHASVSAGGDSRVLGDRRGRPWMVGIKKPRGGDGVAITLPLTDTALSTSGDYERYFIDDKGDWVHHIINPQTGKSTAELASVTVLGPKGFDTDALSTSVFVMGAEKGLALINRLSGFDAVIITRAGKVHYSDGLAAAAQ